MREITPKYALEFKNGIVNFLRNYGQDIWQEISSVKVFDQDFSEKLADYHSEVTNNGLRSSHVALILPREDVNYIVVDCNELSEAEAKSKIIECLEEKLGVAIYHVEYEVSQKSATGHHTVYYSLVETLNEAKKFVRKYGFKTAHFTSRHPVEGFPTAPKLLSVRALAPKLLVAQKPLKIAASLVLAVGAAYLSFGTSNSANAISTSAAFGISQPVPIQASLVSQPQLTKQVVAANKVDTVSKVPVLLENDKDTPINSVFIPKQTSLPNIGFADIGAVAEPTEIEAIKVAIPSLETAPVSKRVASLGAITVSLPDRPILLDQALEVPPTFPRLRGGIKRSAGTVVASSATTKESEPQTQNSVVEPVTIPPAGSVPAEAQGPIVLPEETEVSSEQPAKTLPTHLIPRLRPFTSDATIAAVDVEETVETPNLPKHLIPRLRPSGITAISKVETTPVPKPEVQSTVAANAEDAIAKDLLSQAEKADALRAQNLRNASWMAAKVSSRSPKKPRSFNTLASRVKKNSAARVAAASKPTVAPKKEAVAVAAAKPTKEKSQRASTTFRKNSLSLIGIYGTPSRRSAYFRTSGGSYRKVKLGGRVGGWKVVAIGESSVKVAKGSRNKTMRMPN